MEYVLEKDEVISFVASAGSQILHLLDGRLWLTRSADPQDYVLTPGSRFLVNHAESIVLEAFESASFALVVVDEHVPACLTISSCRQSASLKLSAIP